MITPRELYLKSHAEEAKQLALLVHESWFQRAIVYARASLAGVKITPEQSGGIDMFLHELAGLVEEAPPPFIMPDKSALSTYEHPGVLPPEKEEGAA